jgi:hypothetical protein
LLFTASLLLPVAAAGSDGAIVSKLWGRLMGVGQKVFRKLVA